MVEFLLSADNLPFAVAIGVCLIIAVLELLGLGSSGIDLDVAGDVDADVADAPAALSFLGLGRVPLLIWLLLFCAAFALLGLTGQRLALSLTGGLVSAWLAAPLSALVALPLTGRLAAGLETVLPADESTAISVDELIGRYATVVTGTAAPNSPARARVQDRYGQSHYVMVEPDSNSEVAREGERLLLTSRDGHRFFGILDVSGRVPAIGKA